MGSVAVFSLFAVLVLASSAQPQAARWRRQIFREQVLPHSGGKIPEDAFRTDRLALNRLNKEGIAIPDGVLLETRHRESHFPSHRHDPDIDAAIIKLVQRPDGRYAPPEGRYPFNNLVESTYVIRPPINIHSYGGLPPRKPVQATLQLPARPFFPEDEADESNIDLLNTINQEFPGTRLWTGFGPLFHETANRILRHSGSKKLIGKGEDRPATNRLVTAGSEGKRGQAKSGQPASSPPPAKEALQAAAASSLQLTPQRERAGLSAMLTAAALAQVSAAVSGQPSPVPPRTHLTAPASGFPALQGIPRTAFRCSQGISRMIADPQTNCQVFHLCHPDGRKESFLCPVGSRYDAKSNLCSPWTNVPCPGDT